MDDDYEQTHYANLANYEESRRTLNTPDHLRSDSSSNDSNDFNPDDFNENPGSSFTTSSDDNFVASHEDSDDPVFDRTEWQIVNSRTGKRRPPLQIEFIERLLGNPRYSSYIRWTNDNNGSFEILLPDKVVALWIKVKQRQTPGEMTYEAFSRGLRYYYNKKKILVKTNKKYTFRFIRPLKNIPT